MEPLDTFVVCGAFPDSGNLSVFGDFDFFFPSPDDDACVCLILQHVPDGGFGPGSGADRLDSQRVQPGGNGVCPIESEGSVRLGLSAAVPLENPPDHLGLLRNDLQGIAFVMGELYFSVAVGRGAPHKFSLFHRGQAAPLQPAVDGLEFPAAHKQAEFKVFFVKFVFRIVGFGRSDDLGLGILKGVGHNALVPGVAPGQAFHFDHKHTFPSPGFHVGEKLPDHGAGVDGLSGDHLIIKFRDGHMVCGCKFFQKPPMPLQCFLLSAELRVTVRPALAQVSAVFGGDRVDGLHGNLLLVG